MESPGLSRKLCHIIVPELIKFESLVSFSERSPSFSVALISKRPCTSVDIGGCLALLTCTGLSDSLAPTTPHRNKLFTIQIKPQEVNISVKRPMVEENV